ncbi:hypothetical protein RND81_05G034200 [Saponaria officinalis]|uniref:Uncharacterized protein n=1 Tax=Saponaria officinalis TaxID=3572 RepID=A0AAW1KSX6_SAPOF
MATSPFSIATSPSSLLLLFNPKKSSNLNNPSSFWPVNKRNNDQLHWALRFRCHALSKQTSTGLSTDFREVLQDDLLVTKKQHEIVEDDAERLAIQEELKSSVIKEQVERIRGMLKSMEDGEISISAYDTAWVAMVKDVNGGPQFPASLKWIVDNQHSDGSWGDYSIFSAHDRLISTLACLIALKSWDVFPLMCQKAMTFIEENICKLEDEKAEHMPIGFEIAFPALIEIGRSHGIEIDPNTSPALREIYDMRNLKLTRIPKDIMHRMPTTLLHSIEGMAGLDWEKLLKLQSQDGSFLFSPSSTAYALMQSNDVNCLRYLDNVVRKFNGGVPNVYPVDLFEHIWAVDRLQRLGVSRLFETEINKIMSYIKRYWTDKGICWARNSEVQDIDDTAMAFRLLRLHGYDVSADVFKNFEKDGIFFCFAGQSTQAVTGMYNLFRASQLQYPSETILDEARNFSYKFLREKQASNELFDKWIIAKDLPGEVTFALDMPWYASLPRIESRFYIEQYGGENDVWIGKTLYRMPYVSNDLYLELAKADYNNCQALHRLEWNDILRWYSECSIGEHGVSQSCLLMAHFLAAATLFEPEQSKERLAWAKTIALLEAIDTQFLNDNVSFEDRRRFVNEFRNSYMHQGYVSDDRTNINRDKEGSKLVGLLMSTINQLSLDAFVRHGRDIRNQLCQAWEKWLRTWEKEGDRHKGDAELIVVTIILCGGRYVTEDIFSHAPTVCLLDMTNRLCHHLGHVRRRHNMVHANGTSNEEKNMAKLDEDMQSLTKAVLSNNNGIDSWMKQTCLAIIRTSYYAAYCTLQEIDYHISKVLFQKVD